MSIVPADKRRELPDEPAVYPFRDDRGRVLYVGKAKSIRKRVASHFSNPSTRGGRDLVDQIDQIEALVVHTEAEALLAEQNFIKQYKPRFNIPGSIWLPDTGYGRLAPATEDYFKRGVAGVLEGNKSAMIVIYCLADCWMSWNAAKRILSMGYANVAWYPDGTDGWTEELLPVTEAQPEPAAGD